MKTYTIGWNESNCEHEMVPSELVHETRPEEQWVPAETATELLQALKHLR